MKYIRAFILGIIAATAMSSLAIVHLHPNFQNPYRDGSQVKFDDIAKVTSYQESYTGHTMKFTLSYGHLLCQAPKPACDFVTTPKNTVQFFANTDKALWELPDGTTAQISPQDLADLKMLEKTTRDTMEKIAARTVYPGSTFEYDR